MSNSTPKKSVRQGPRGSGLLKSYGLKGPLLAAPDLHAPFMDMRWCDAFHAEVKITQPETVVQVGDARDYFWLSRYAKTLNIMTPEEELTKGTEQLHYFWEGVRDAAPKAKCYQILGNHDDRAVKRLFENAPELEVFIDLQEPFRFEGVETVNDSAEELFIGEIAVLHGHKKNGEHARYNQCPTIHGHTHQGGVWMFRNRRGAFWELDCGFAGDLESPVFHYRAQRKIHTWNMGWGVVDEKGPRFALFHN